MKLRITAPMSLQLENVAFQGQASSRLRWINVKPTMWATEQVRIPIVGILLGILLMKVFLTGQTIAREVPDNPESICPILIGQSLPKIEIQTKDNDLFDLNAAIAKKPAVLIFFRGGWCMYCNRQLSQLKSIESALIEMGYQIIAISPDRPEILNRPADEYQLKYQLFSDSAMTAAKSLGIAFRLDDKTFTKYKNDYGIDIEADSGQSHHLLPVPAAFIVDTDGMIHFSYINPNYKVRVDPKVLLEAAKAALQSKEDNPPKGLRKN